MPALQPTTGPSRRERSITYTENRFTNADRCDGRRLPHAAAGRDAHLRADRRSRPRTAPARFSFDEWSRDGFALLRRRPHEIAVRADARTSVTEQKRLIEHVRTLYRRDDLTRAACRSATVESLALPGESYKLAFTPGLLAQVYRRPRRQPTRLLPNPTAARRQGRRSGRLRRRTTATGGSRRAASSYSPDTQPTHRGRRSWRTPAQHFFLPRRYRDPFGTTRSARRSVDLRRATTCWSTRDRATPLGNAVDRARQRLPRAAAARW